MYYYVMDTQRRLTPDEFSELTATEVAWYLAELAASETHEEYNPPTVRPDGTAYTTDDFAVDAPTDVTVYVR